MQEHAVSARARNAWLDEAGYRPRFRHLRNPGSLECLFAPVTASHPRPRLAASVWTASQRRHAMYEPSRHVATFFIAGFQHWDGALLLPELRVGMRLRSSPSPTTRTTPTAWRSAWGSARSATSPRRTTRCRPCSCTTATTSSSCASCRSTPRPTPGSRCARASTSPTRGRGAASGREARGVACGLTPRLLG